MIRTSLNALLLLTGLREPGWLAVSFHRLLHRGYLSGHAATRSAAKAINTIVGPFVEAWTGVTLPPQARVGRNLKLHHRGKIVVNPGAEIGDDCVLVHGVTIGNRTPGGAAPRLGNRVEVGAYAQILGPITVGDGARIGALAVVVHDVPAGSIVRGASATIYPPVGAP